MLLVMLFALPASLIPGAGAEESRVLGLAKQVAPAALVTAVRRNGTDGIEVSGTSDWRRERIVEEFRKAVEEQGGTPGSRAVPSLGAEALLLEATGSGRAEQLLIEPVGLSGECRVHFFIESPGLATHLPPPVLERTPELRDLAANVVFVHESFGPGISVARLLAHDSRSPEALLVAAADRLADAGWLGDRSMAGELHALRLRRGRERLLLEGVPFRGGSALSATLTSTEAAGAPRSGH